MVYAHLDCETVSLTARTGPVRAAWCAARWPATPRGLLRATGHQRVGCRPPTAPRRPRARGPAPLRQAGFILPDPASSIALADRTGSHGSSPRSMPATKRRLAADRDGSYEHYVATHRRRDDLHTGRYLPSAASKSSSRGLLSLRLRLRRAAPRRASGRPPTLLRSDAARHRRRCAGEAADSWGAPGSGVGARRGFSLKLCDCPTTTAVSTHACGSRSSAGSSIALPSTKASVPAKDAAHDRTQTAQPQLYRAFPRHHPLWPGAQEVPLCHAGGDLGDAFKARARKRPHPDFTGPLTESSSTIWSAMCEQRTGLAWGNWKIQRLPMDRTPESIYSPASLSKGFPCRLWLPSCARANMAARRAGTWIFGGGCRGLRGVQRISAGVRRCWWRPALGTVFHLDFKSQYVSASHPRVCKPSGSLRW